MCAADTCIAHTSLNLDGEVGCLNRRGLGVPFDYGNVRHMHGPRCGAKHFVSSSFDFVVSGGRWTRSLLFSAQRFVLRIWFLLGILPVRE